MIGFNHIYNISQSIPVPPRLYPTLNLRGCSLSMWSILWELPVYTLGYSPGAHRLYPKVYSRLYPGIVQNIPGYTSVGGGGGNLGGYTGIPRKYKNITIQLLRQKCLMVDPTPLHIRRSRPQFNFLRIK